VLVQESLGQIGINDRDQTRFRRQLAQRDGKKSMPLMVNFFSAGSTIPSTSSFWCYSGQNAIFNTPSYVNPDMDALIDGARAAAAVGDKEKYSRNVEGFISKA